jgi:transcriptional regulator with XRE-family HTH domain
MTPPAACLQAPTGTDSPARQEAGGRDVGATLRRARTYRGLSLRDVERRTGRPNAYLSQVERGVIRKPDPVFIWQLANLYDLDFELLMHWSGGDVNASSDPLEDAVVAALIRQIVNLTPSQRSRALALIVELSQDGGSGQ